MTSYPWHNLAPMWGDDLHQAQLEIDWRKAHPEYASGDWTPRREFCGKLGERVFYLETGQPMTNTVGPDRGRDFVIDGETSVDIKACWWPHHGKVLEVPRCKDLVADWYVLVVIDEEQRRGRVVGAAPRGRLAAAPHIDRYAPHAPARVLMAGTQLDPLPAYWYGAVLV